MPGCVIHLHANFDKFAINFLCVMYADSSKKRANNSKFTLAKHNRVESFWIFSLAAIQLLSTNHINWFDYIFDLCKSMSLTMTSIDKSLFLVHSCEKSWKILKTEEITAFSIVFNFVFIWIVKPCDVILTVTFTCILSILKELQWVSCVRFWAMGGVNSIV